MEEIKAVVKELIAPKNIDANHKKAQAQILKSLKVVQSLCNNIKDSSKQAFNFDLVGDDLFACSFPQSDSKDSREQALALENMFNIIYFVHVETSEFFMRKGVYKRAKPNTNLINVEGIKGGVFI